MINQDEIIQERYRIVRRLGSGGFGAVYLAQDQRLGRQVAIKEMDETRLGPEERQIASQLFEREAQMLAALDHPGLTRVWDYFQHGRRAFLVMEYVPGQTLRDMLIKRGGPLPEPFVLECALQLCAVLAYLHTRRPQVIFRDLKPGNVMVIESADALEPPVVKLIDFGIARLFKPEQVGDTLIIGTPGYAPPEQYGQGQTDQRSDIYSLGATLHHLLSGQAPGGLPLPPLSSVAPAVSPELARVISRATELDPAERYPNVEAMRRDLLAVAPDRYQLRQAPVFTPAADGGASRPTPNPRVTTPLPAPALAPARPIQSSPAALWILLVVVLGVAAIGAVTLGALNRPGGTPARPAVAATPLPQPTAPPAAVEWSLPDAPGRILFGRFDGGLAYTILLATLDGQPPRPVTSSGTDFSPTWAPDGERIAFARIVVKDQRAAILIAAPGAATGTEVVPPNGYARYPAFSPDGNQLAFATAPNRAGNFQLATLDLATGAIRLRGPDRTGWITWSPQGLTYAARTAPDQQDIFVLGADDTPRNLTNTPDVEEDFPAWSPGGRQLAFVGSPPGQANLGQRQIYVMNADGSGRAQLTSGSGPYTNPVWSPDGKWIAYLAQQGGGDWQVWAMRADGSEPRQITFGPQQKFYLAWGK